MITMNEAVKSAMKTFDELYRDQPVKDPLLEEIELSDREKAWNVTIGFSVEEATLPTALDQMMARVPPFDALPPKSLPQHRQLVRKYKVFSIDSEDGTFRAMKLKES